MMAFIHTVFRFCVVILSLASQADCRENICEENVCTYSFEIYRKRTMTYTDPTSNRSFNVEPNGTHLVVAPNSFYTNQENPLVGQAVDPKHVITGVGTYRNIITINGQFPGPTVEVLHGTEIVISVINKLHSESVTIHWHGMYQQNNVWMDGVPYVTMCPIPPRGRFIYRFIADPPGTHWYHSHLTAQRLDGLFGMLIVHPRLPTMTYYSFSILDFLKFDHHDILMMDPEQVDHLGPGDNLARIPDREYAADGSELSAVMYYSTMINGKGRLEDANTSLPLEEFRVQPQRTYRFHMVNSGAAFSYDISIDNHMLTAIASDGHAFRPIEVNSIMIHSGETIDFEVKMNQNMGKYWLRAETMRASKGLPLKPDGIIRGGKAKLLYGNETTETGEPSTTRLTCNSTKPCVVFNCPFRGYADHMHKTCVGFADEARSQYDRRFYKDFGLETPQAEILELFFNFGFAYGSSINARRFKEPSGPLFSQNTARYIEPCNSTDCLDGCLCTNIQHVPMNRTVQFVISIYEPPSPLHNFAHHPVHIHGTSFAVVKIGYPNFNRTTGLRGDNNPDVICDNERFCARPSWRNNRPELNLVDPPIKDTIIVPAGGYVVIQFIAKNPGHWLIHCHVEHHFFEGMGMLIHIGEGQEPPLPQGYPMCDTFEWTEEQFRQYYGQRSRASTAVISPTDVHVSTETKPPTVSDVVAPWTKVKSVSTTSTPENTDNGMWAKVDTCKLTLQNVMADSFVVLRSDQLIGAVAGFTILGAVIVAIPFVYLSCRDGKASYST